MCTTISDEFKYHTLIRRKYKFNWLLMIYVHDHSSFLNLNCWISSESGWSSFSSTNLNSSMKKIKCLKQVFRWYYNPRARITWKWVWYIWAYILNSLLKIVFTTDRKFLGNGTPIWHGNRDSLLNWFSTHVINNYIYSGAGTFKGVLIFWQSAHRYSKW